LLRLDRTRLAFLIVPPVAVGIVLGANQVRAGAYLPWLLSIGYWISISLVTWLLFAAATFIAGVALRPWSPPRWVAWVAGAVGGSLAARPAIYQLAAWFAPLMDRPALREMPPFAPTAEFLFYYATNWSVIIAMWMATCAAEAWWRRQNPQRTQEGTAPTPPGAVVSTDAAWMTGIFAKLPVGLGHDVLAVHSEDHYVRIYTPLGDALVLGTMSDAIATLERGGSSGQQVHRCWWVASGAVTETLWQGRRLVARLSNGLEVPVSQTYREVARVSGVVKLPATA
jgi:LytTr DNA-binding domain